MHRPLALPVQTTRRSPAKWSEDERPPEALVARLAAAGLRPTRLRCDVLGVLLAGTGDTPPHTAEEVFREVACDSTSLPNIYRILAELVEAGLVERKRPEGGRFVFAMRGALPAGHLACVHCHTTEPVIDPWVLARAEALCRRRGLSLERLSWRMSGRCRACLSSPRGGRSPSGGAGSR